MKQLAEMQDAELLSHYRTSGDKACVGILYKRYVLLVYGVCFKYLKNEEASKDMVADIFEHLIEHLKKTEVEYFKSWLYIVCRNHVFRQLRRDGKKTQESFEELEEKNPGVFVENMADESLNNKPEDIEFKETQLRTAIQSLKAEQQVCIELFYLQKKSYQEIAAFTAYDIKQVKSHIQNGKRNLRIILESKGYSK